MKLVLYNPPSSANRKPILPMSLLALGAVLEGEHDYVIVDGNLEASPLAALDRALGETGARTLGVTVMPGPQLWDAVPLCQALKAKSPDLTIVWGGYFPTQHHDACLRDGAADYVVCGHGEHVFRALVTALARGEDPTSLPGLAYRRAGTGEIVANPAGPIPHPDELPDFPYYRVEMERYVRSTFMGRRTLPHHSSYGCPFLCNFCGVVSMTGGRWLAQSAERTAAAARNLVQRFGADAIELYDSNFFVNEGRTAEFAERIRDLRIAWWGEARIDTLLGYSERTWERMRDSGLKMAFLGAESASDETLERMNKGGTAKAEQTLLIVEKMKRYGIVPELSFVLGNPPEPEEDTERTIEFIRKVKRINPSAEIILYLYTPVPLAGGLYALAEARGFQFPKTLEEWTSPSWREFSQRRSAHMPWLSDPVRRRARDFERVLNATYPTVTDLRLTGWRRWTLKAMGGWRYHLRWYGHASELKALNKLLAYQRPETCGF